LSCLLKDLFAELVQESRFEVLNHGSYNFAKLHFEFNVLGLFAAVDQQVVDPLRIIEFAQF